MSALDDLTASVTAMSASVDAAIAKLATIPADNSAQLAALKDQLDAARAKLDTAVATHGTP